MRLGLEERQSQGHTRSVAAQSSWWVAQLRRRYCLTWPDPVTTYLVEVISGRPIGPRVQLLRGDSDLGTEPELSSPPSTNRLEALTSTAAASTSAVNRAAEVCDSVTIVSEWPVL